MIEDKPLRQIIEETPPGNVIFRTDYPQYNAEFVGNVLAKLVEEGNIRRPGPVPRFSDLEVVALSLAAESEGIDSEN